MRKRRDTAPRVLVSQAPIRKPAQRIGHYVDPRPLVPSHMY
jgi:hypothetical protein